MKKIVLIVFAVTITLSASAQNPDHIFKPFKVDVAMGIAIPQGSGTNLGFNGAIEPKYAVLEQLAVGLRIEGLAAVHNFNVGEYQNDSEGDVTTSTSYLGTADYYFSNRAFRPFVGAGLGVYKTGKTTYKSADGSYYDYDIPSSSKFGGMIRAGFEVLHFRLGAEYNFVGNSSYTSPYTQGQLKNGYFSLKFGVFIGGGKY